MEARDQSAEREALPPLPDPAYGWTNDYYSGWSYDEFPSERYHELQLYTEEQMREYARAALSLHAKAPAPWPQGNPWAEAIDEARIAHALDCTTEADDPTTSLKELMYVAENMALDPAISKRANALLNTIGAAKAMGDANVTAPSEAAGEQPVGQIVGNNAIERFVVWFAKDFVGMPAIGTRLFTSPQSASPAQARMPLSDARINAIGDCMPTITARPPGWWERQFARAIEAAHGIQGESSGAAPSGTDGEQGDGNA